MDNQPTIKHLIFDLGGVLIELSGIAEVIQWSGNIHSEEQLWQRWINSPAIRAFESGKIEVDEFIKTICEEFEITIDPKHFLDRFLQWPQGPYPDVKPFLNQLKQHISFSCLSNTSSVHWEKVRDEMKLATFFSHTFLSFEIGLFKPDIEIFEFVATQLPYQPEEILFFDDNQVNIDSARIFGFKAEKVIGVQEIKHQLNRYQIPYYQ